MTRTTTSTCPIQILIELAARAGNSCTPAEALNILQTWPGPNREVYAAQGEPGATAPDTSRSA